MMETTAVATTLADVAFREGRRLAQDPNICAVGYGAKLRGGAPAGQGTLVFYVREKLRSSHEIAARGSWAVPARVAGFETDVVAVGHLAAATADRAPPTGARGTRIAAPLLGGAATASLGTSLGGPGGYGTIGGLCFDNTTGAPTFAPLLLSNAHVWGPGTVATEVIQPPTASTIFGAAVSPAVVGQTPLVVQTRLLPALAAPIAFANAMAQTYLVTGGDLDPMPFGQAATPVAATTRTDSEQVTISAPVAGLAPAGRRVSQTVGWTYQRLATAAVLQASSNQPRTQTKLLAARRLFTDKASYTASAGLPVNLYAEIVPAAGGGPGATSAHQALVLLYPLPAGDRTIPRLLRPAAKQTPPNVTTQFTGFPSPPAKANGVATFPLFIAGGIAVDCDLSGTFKSVTGLPTGTFAVQLPSGPSTSPVRVFVPPSTSVTIDIDPSGLSTLVAQGVNSAGDSVGTVATANGTGTRKLVTVSASELVEVRLTGAGTMLLCGVTSLRKPNIETAPPPLQYAGAANMSDLTTGHWGASLFVQALDSGLPESANVVEAAIGMQALVVDCQFDVV
jgi:hypothetical protein